MALFIEELQRYSEVSTLYQYGRREVHELPTRNNRRMPDGENHRSRSPPARSTGTKRQWSVFIKFISTQILNQGPTDLESNPILPEHETGLLTSQSRHSVHKIKAEYQA
jgi:hypothetical protein